jgi:hypothetical protein
MPANTSPIFPVTPVVSWVSGTAATAGTPGREANTTTDMTTGAVYGPVFTAGESGSRVDVLRVRPLGTNTSTVIRVWINNGGATTTAANNTIFAERSAPSTTVSQTSELADLLIPTNVSLPAGYRIYVTFGTSVAAGFHVTALAGDY